jgi:hypothetical protein
MRLLLIDIYNIISLLLNPDLTCGVFEGRSAYVHIYSCCIVFWGSDSVLEVYQLAAISDSKLKVLFPNPLSLSRTWLNSSSSPLFFFFFAVLGSNSGPNHAGQCSTLRPSPSSATCFETGRGLHGKSVHTCLPLCNSFFPQILAP